MASCALGWADDYHLADVPSRRSGRRQILSSLLGLGADADAPCGPQGQVIMSYVIQHSDPTALRILIDGKADPNIPDADGMTPIFHIGELPHFEPMLSALIQAGANIDHASQTGYTPLMRFAALSIHRAVELLITHGANVNLWDESNANGLYYACDIGPPETISLLLDSGAEASPQCPSPATPIVRASRMKVDRSVALQILLQHGADPNDENEDGETPLILVLRHPSRNDRDMAFEDWSASVKVLLDHGARLERVHRRLQDSPQSYRKFHDYGYLKEALLNDTSIPGPTRDHLLTLFW